MTAKSRKMYNISWTFSCRLPHHKHCTCITKSKQCKIMLYPILRLIKSFQSDVIMCLWLYYDPGWRAFVPPKESIRFIFVNEYTVFHLEHKPIFYILIRRILFLMSKYPWRFSVRKWNFLFILIEHTPKKTICRVFPSVQILTYLLHGAESFLRS